MHFMIIDVPSGKPTWLLNMAHFYSGYTPTISVAIEKPWLRKRLPGGKPKPFSYGFPMVLPEGSP